MMRACALLIVAAIATGHAPDGTATGGLPRTAEDVARPRHGRVADPDGYLNDDLIAKLN
eukprot:gene12511-10746_t